MPVATTTIGSRRWPEMVSRWRRRCPTWWTSNWTRTRWRCTGAAGRRRAAAARRPTARRRTTAPRRWTLRRRRRSLDRLRRRRPLGVAKTRRTRYAACAATRRSASTSTPSPASPARRSFDETRQKDLSVYYYSSLLKKFLLHLLRQVAAPCTDKKHSASNICKSYVSFYCIFRLFTFCVFHEFLKGLCSHIKTF